MSDDMDRAEWTLVALMEVALGISNNQAWDIMTMDFYSEQAIVKAMRQAVECNVKPIHAPTDQEYERMSARYVQIGWEECKPVDSGEAPR